MSNPVSQKQLISDALRFHGAGQLRSAEQLYRQVLSADSGNAEALHYLGVIAMQSGDFTTAVKYISDAISNRPDYADALSNLGNAQQSLGQLDDAIGSYEKAVALNPDMAETRANLGNARSQLGHFEMAVADYRAALQSKPALPEVHRNLSTALLALGKPDDALQSIRQASKLAPDSLPILVSLGNILHETGNWRDAVQCFERALNVEPESGRIHCNLGNTLRNLGRFDEAVSHYDVAMSLTPDSAEVNYGRGMAYQDSGDFESAISCFRRAIATEPGMGKAHHAMAKLIRHTEHDDDILGMETAIGDGHISDEHKFHLAFGLGKSFEDLGQHKIAFGHYKMANELRRKSIHYDETLERQFFANLKSTFTESAVANDAGNDPESTRVGVSPIFIVGMPRSGTSLIEQILASHPQVYGAGELSTITRCIAGKLSLRDGIDYTGDMATATSEDLRAIGDEYCREIASRASGANYVTDKMPQNFLNIGMIGLVLPNARIVHCRRNPLDTCLSIYKNFLPAGGHNYAYDLSELGRYYLLYVDLMAHWHEVFPGAIIDIDYEALVANQEPESRRLLDACGLEWDPACIEFHKTQRQVATLSASQVRKPIYGDSVELWRRYGDQLAPLIDILDQRTQAPE